jgi:hypothetical protein
MTKWGLVFEVIGFLMLFWQSYGRQKRKLKNGGGVTTDQASENLQMERALKWIPNKCLRKNLTRMWQMIALGFIIAGVIFQLIAIW